MRPLQSHGHGMFAARLQDPAQIDGQACTQCVHPFHEVA
jgi:hypothetical protein